MTAVTTSANKQSSFFSVRFRNRFSDDLKLFITNMLFHLLCLPVIVGIILKVTYMEDLVEKGLIRNYDETSVIPFLIIAAISFCLSVALGIVIPMMNFRYLYSKSLVDMNYSLPLNHRQRFCADFFTGLIAYIVPPLVGAAIAGIELFIGSQFIDMSEIMPFVPVLVKYGFSIIAGMVLLYTISVFAMTFAGSTFEAIFSIFAVNIMIPAVVFLTWMNIVNAARFGLVSDSVAKNFTFFTTSPIGVFSYVMFASERGVSPLLYSYNSDDYAFSSVFQDSLYFNFMIRIIFFIVLLIVVGFLLYKHRKAEDVSKPYVYKAFYYIIMSLSVYCIVSALKMTSLSSGLFAAIIISGILWFVMEVIRRRGFKRFWTAVISFAAASAVVIGVIKVIDTTQGLGIAKRIPSASSVTDLEIDTWGTLERRSGDLLMHDPEVINDVIELNKELVDRHFNKDNYEYALSDYRTDMEMYYDSYEENEDKTNYYYDEQDFRVVYYLKNGSAIERQYTVPTGMLEKIFCDIYTSEEYAEQVSSRILRDSLRRLQAGDYSYELTTETADHCSFAIMDMVGEYHRFDLSVKEGIALADAVRSDIIAMQTDDLRNAEYYCELGDISITSAFKNTISFFEKHDIKYNFTSKELVSEIDTYSEQMVITDNLEYVFPLFFFQYASYEDDYRMDYYEDTSNRDFIKLDTIFSLNPYRDRSRMGFKGKHMVFDDPVDIEKLFDIATPIVIGEVPIAEINYGNTTLFILDRPGNREIIEKAKKTINICENNTELDYYYD